MVEQVIASLYCKYKSSKSQLLSSLVQRIQTSVNIRRGPGFDATVHRDRAWIGGQLLHAATKELIWKRHQNKTAQFLGKLIDRFASRNFKRTIVAVSGVRDSEICDLHWAIDDFDNDGEDVMEVISNILCNGWTWAYQRSGCDKLKDEDKYLNGPYDAEEGAFVHQSKNLICMNTDRTGISFTTFGVLHLDTVLLNAVKTKIYDTSIYNKMLDALLLLIKAGYEWKFPPTKSGKVFSDVQQFKAKAFRGDARWYLLVIKILKKRFPNAPRLFIISLFQAINSNDFLNALGRVKRGALPGGGADLSVHEGGSYLEGAIAQSIEDNEDNLEVVEDWAEATITRACDYVEQVYMLIMSPSPSPNPLKRSEPPTTRDSDMHAQKRTNPHDNVPSPSHSYSGHATSSRPSGQRGNLPGRRPLLRSRPELSIVPNVHPNLQHLVILRMMENTKKTEPAMASGTVVPVPLKVQQPSQPQISSASYRGSGDCTSSSRKDNRSPHRSMGSTRNPPAQSGVSVQAQRQGDKYSTRASSSKPSPTHGGKGVTPGRHRSTTSKLDSSRMIHMSGYCAR